MKKIFQVILIIAALFLALLAFRSIMRPEKFKVVYDFRDKEIRNRLLTIRAIQTVYKTEHKTYATNVDQLVDFVNNGIVNIVKNVGEIPESMTEEEAFKKGLIKKETVQVPAKGKIIETDKNVVDYLQDFQYIPFNYGKKFEIQNDSIVTRTYTIPVYKIEIPVDDILANMTETISPKNSSAISRFFNYLIYDDLANEHQYKIKYKPIWMGSLTEANTAGSWE
ncbi:MAG: hypothetical protein LBU51_06425 [Bacteroidales bacterium]|jgi:hypothetical protein|nr:hypothetical protein [Bacteroidales bacterium]